MRALCLTVKYTVLMKKQKTSEEKNTQQNTPESKSDNKEFMASGLQEDTDHTPEDDQQVRLDTKDVHTDCKDKIASLESRLEEANDKFLRLFSEFDNYRKRTARERADLTKTAGADIIAALLPVLDDLERACKIACNADDINPMLEGMKLILSKFKAVLRQIGVEEIEAEGADFDTDYHEAITHVPAPDESMKGKVLEEIQKGYLLHGKVIRYARVVVAN